MKSLEELKFNKPWDNLKCVGCDKLIRHENEASIIYKNRTSNDSLKRFMTQSFSHWQIMQCILNYNIQKPVFNFLQNIVILFF